MSERREREAPELQAACVRMMKALARRAGGGELEALEALHNLTGVSQYLLGKGVAGYRQGPAEASWSTIGSVLHMTRQSAHERFQHCEPLSEDAHLWGSVTQTLCGRDAFRVVGTHVDMTSGTILRVVDTQTDATCSDCLAHLSSGARW